MLIKCAFVGQKNLDVYIYIYIYVHTQSPTERQTVRQIDRYIDRLYLDRQRDIQASLLV
jgi:hypothetical protein